MLYIAEKGTASDVETLVRGYRRASRGEDVAEARRQQKERYLDMYTDEDGMVVIRGRLPQEVAALLEKALEAAMDALREEARNEEHSDGGSPSYDSAESFEECGQVDPDDSAESFREPYPSVSRDSAESWPGESLAQRRADALGLLAEAALGKGLGQNERGEPYQVR